jgi:trans-2,3-dihydro-3-hydroxyanthranilate isomerase
MALTFHTLDVFTTQRFGGNPLAVVLDADRLKTAEMQAVAREFNLSETVFVMAPEDASHTARVRIFTPGRELPFAGHPTVGTAVLLAKLGRADATGGEALVTLEEKIGLIPVQVQGADALAPHAELTAAELPRSDDGAVPSDDVLAAALGLAPDDIGFDAHRPSVHRAGLSFVFVPVRSREVLARTRLDVGKWPAGHGDVGVYAYCRGAAAEVDFHSRMFGLGDGIVEDPATGSAAAIFAGPIHAATPLADGTHRFRIAQGEDMGRPSAISLEADVARGALARVRVGGHAVLVARGEIRI